MEPNYPQLTIEELNALLSSAIIQLQEEQRKIGIDNRKLIKLFYEIYYECHNNGALFYNIVPDYETKREDWRIRIKLTPSIRT